MGDETCNMLVIFLIDLNWDIYFIFLKREEVADLFYPR